MVAWAFNWIISQIAWTIIRFEIHHLWDPDWTYAFPQNFQQTVSDNNGGNNNVPVVENGEDDDMNDLNGEQFMTGEEYDETTTVRQIFCGRTSDVEGGFCYSSRLYHVHII